jgi:hypothetical protein
VLGLHLAVLGLHSTVFLLQGPFGSRLEVRGNQDQNAVEIRIGGWLGYGFKREPQIKATYPSSSVCDIARTVAPKRLLLQATRPQSSALTKPRMCVIVALERESKLPLPHPSSRSDSPRSLILHLELARRDGPDWTGSLPSVSTLVLLNVL